MLSKMKGLGVVGAYNFVFDGGDALEFGCGNRRRRFGDGCPSKDVIGADFATALEALLVVL